MSSRAVSFCNTPEAMLPPRKISITNIFVSQCRTFNPAPSFWLPFVFHFGAKLNFKKFVELEISIFSMQDVLRLDQNSQVEKKTNQ